MPTGVVYDERCSGHSPPDDGYSPHVECPARSIAIWDSFQKLGLAERCVRVPARKATIDELKSCHSDSHIDLILGFEADANDLDVPSQFQMIGGDTYLVPGSATAALVAVGGLIDLCEQVVTGRLKNGFSILRPPGHHAGIDGPAGFCLFNNVAVAARMMQQRHPDINRVLIFDWDVHHGDGTEDIFYEDGSVLFMSVHRGGGFYPCTGLADDVGDLDGEGFTVNVPLPTDSLGDGVYLALMNEIFLPIIREFAPDLIIVSAGYDAALGDPLGGMNVSASGFAAMAALLAECQPRIVLALEGGYNLDAISSCAARCLEALLGSAEVSDSTPPLDCVELLEVIADVKKAQMPFWSCFQMSGDEFALADAQSVSLLNEIKLITSTIYSEYGGQPSEVRADPESPDSESQEVSEHDTSSSDQVVIE